MSVFILPWNWEKMTINIYTHTHIYQSIVSCQLQKLKLKNFQIKIETGKQWMSILIWNILFTKQFQESKIFTTSCFPCNISPGSKWRSAIELLSFCPKSIFFSQVQECSCYANNLLKERFISPAQSSLIYIFIQENLMKM